MRADVLAQKILKIIYGGRMRANNDQITERQVLEAIRIERDFVVRDWMENNASTGKPVDDSMFTAYETEVLWDESRLVAYIDFPYGYLTLPHDKGIRINPVSGRNLFRRVPSGYSSTVADNAPLDGVRIPWEVTPVTSGSKRRVIFPTWGNQPGKKLLVEVVIGDSRALPAAEVGIPDGLESIVESRVLSKYRPFVNDKANDGRSQP